MKLDVNELAEYLANTPFRVEGVYRYAKIQVCLVLSLQILSQDLYFHLQGRRNFNLMVRRISFPQEKLYMGCKMTLAHKMLGEINWEYILVLYRISNSEREDSGFTHQHFELLTGQSLVLSNYLCVFGMCIISEEAFRCFRLKCCFAKR